MSNDINDMDKEAFNTECPICFDESGKMIILSCLHRFHSECLEGHTDLNCPKCRQNVVNWPPKLKEKIKENSLDFQEELDEEDRQNIIENERNMDDQILSRMTMFIQPPPQIEILTALNYLRDRDIPLSYIPRKIRIKVVKGQPKPPSGSIFTAIVGQTLESIREDIRLNNLDTSSDDSSDDSSDEDPFSEENESLEEISRNIEVVEIDE